MASVQAIMSVPKSNSCGSCAAAMTRTPSLTSSVVGWVLGSVPVGRRRQHHDLVAGGGQCGGELVDVAAEPADRPPAGTPTRPSGSSWRHAASGAAGRRVRRTVRRRGSSPSASRCGVLAAARGQRVGDLPGGVGVQVRAVARVVGGGVLADHERPVAGHRQQRLAQDLVGDQVARVGAPTAASAPAPCPRCVSAVSTTSVLSCTRSATCSPAHTCQSLPEPQELGGNSTGAPTNPSAMRVGQRADADPGLGQRAQHPLQPHRALVPPVAEQFGVEGGDHVGGPADALGLGDQPLAHHVDEVGDVGVDRARRRAAGRTAPWRPRRRCGR